jgi:hypothetical protein
MRRFWRDTAGLRERRSTGLLQAPLILLLDSSDRVATTPFAALLGLRGGPNMKKVTITNYRSDGDTEYPHGLEAELLLVRTDPFLKCSQALAYVKDAKGVGTKGLIVTLFQGSRDIDVDSTEPWVLNEHGFKFSEETSDEAIKNWIDLLAFAV